MDWQRLGSTPPAQLAPARLQAHWAAQVLAAAGETFVPATPDTGHTAMTWDAPRGALLGREMPGAAAAQRRRRAVARRRLRPRVLLVREPLPRERELPPLAAGEWFRDGWTGAVLRGSDVVAAGDASAQRFRVEAFLASAVPASRALALSAPL